MVGWEKVAYAEDVLVRDHIQVAEQILAEIRGLGKDGTTKREFMMQLRNFIRDCKYYPPEARYPWDKLGHIVREYCCSYGQEQTKKWQQITLDIIRRQT